MKISNRSTVSLFVITGALLSVQAIAAQSYPQQNYPPQNHPQQGYPQQGYPQQQPQQMPRGIDPFTLRALPSAGLHFMLQGGISLGGTEMAALKYSDGYYGTNTDTIHAGALENIGAGAVLQFVDSPISLSAAINFAQDQASSGDTDLTFRRTPLDFMLHSQFQRNRFGLGVTQHTNIQYDAKQYATSYASSTASTINDRVRYKDATGVMAEWSYLLGANTWFTTRYTNIQYEPDTLNGQAVSNGEKINGSNIAFGLRAIF